MKCILHIKVMPKWHSVIPVLENFIINKITVFYLLFFSIICNLEINISVFARLQQRTFFFPLNYLEISCQHDVTSCQNTSVFLTKKDILLHNPNTSKSGNSHYTLSPSNFLEPHPSFANSSNIPWETRRSYLDEVLY